MPSDTLRQITGTFADPSGTIYSNRTMTWFKETRSVQGQGTTTVLDQPFYEQTDADGVVDFEVMTGRYLVQVQLQDVDRYFRVSVPDEAGPFDISTLIDGPAPVEPDDLTDFQALVNKAKAWATAAPNVEVESGQYSARHWAGVANGYLAPALEQAEGYVAQTAQDRVATGADVIASEQAASDAQDTLDAVVLAAEANGAYREATIAAAIAAGVADLTVGDTFAAAADDVDYIGLYVVEAGSVATEIARMALKSAVDQEFSDLKQFISPSVSKDIERAADKDGKIYRRVDAGGAMSIAGLDETVQDALKSRSVSTSPVTPSRDVMQAHDAGDNVIMRMDERGAMYIPGQAGSIQHGLRQSLKRVPQHTTPKKTARDKYAASVLPLMTDLAAQGAPYIPAPATLVPNGYDIPDAVLGLIELSDDNPVPPLPFPYATGGSVHPYLIECREPMYGYKYLLAETNHRNGSEGEETPVMFGSNDLYTFDLIPDVPQPLDYSRMRTDLVGSGYSSDTFFSYDPTDGALIWGANNGGTELPNKVVMSRTYDGVNWTPKEEFESPGLSPAILYDPVGAIWHYWISGGFGSFSHYTGPSASGPWTLSSTQDFRSAHGFEIWHQEVKYLGDRFALCAHQRDSGGNISQVYLGLSSDGDTWVMSGGLVSPQTNGKYKPSFLPEFDGDLVRFVFVWSHWDWVLRQTSDIYLHVQYSNWIDLSSI